MYAAPKAIELTALDIRKHQPGSTGPYNASKASQLRRWIHRTQLELQRGREVYGRLAAGKFTVWLHLQLGDLHGRSIPGWHTNY